MHCHKHTHTNYITHKHITNKRHIQTHHKQTHDTQTCLLDKSNSIFTNKQNLSLSVIKMIRRREGRGREGEGEGREKGKGGRRGREEGGREGKGGPETWFISPSSLNIGCPKG